MPNTHNLHPFDNTEEGRRKAAEAGRKGGLTRARNAAAKREQERVANLAPAQALDELRNRFNREELGETAAQVAMLMLSKLVTGEIEVTGRDIAPLVQVLVNIVRLEEGQATSHTAHVALSASDAMDRIKQLRAQGSAPNENRTLPSVDTAGSVQPTTVSELENPTPNPGGQGGTPGETPPRKI